MFTCYRDLWKTESEKRNAVRQSMISDDGCTLNCMRLHATIAENAAIAKAYGNKFIIPLDFGMLDSAMPYYQAGLENRLCMKLLSMIMEKLLMQQDKQQPQMLSIRFQIYP